MPRIVFPADTAPEILAAWIAEAQAAPFTGPIDLPIVRRTPPEPPPPMDALFDRLPIQRRGERQRPEPPPPGTPLYKVVGGIFEGVIAPPSPLAEKRRERRAEREAAAKAAAREAKSAAKAKAGAAATAPPALELTMDMGRFKDAHGIDRCEVGAKGGYVVACPPFHLHDEDHVEPVDEFLGQVVGIKAARALLFRSRDPSHGYDVGQRYLLLRFWDDDEGEVWCQQVHGDGDEDVLPAVYRTVLLYRRSKT